jgi:2-keto-4-pentenoate hydratase/2-oxohepta-3-ene-1,7-dioic acid hydratase in catechol pathway
MNERISFDKSRKFISLGGAFTTHVDSDRPKKWPDIWSVPSEAIIDDGDAIELPPEVEDVTIGPELTAVVGKPMWRVNKTEVADSIAGFTISNDVTAKGEWPGYANKRHPYITGTGYKIFPTFRPTLSTYEPLEIDDVANLHVEATVDSEIVVEGSTADIAFSFEEIFTHVSKIVKLNPGDLVALGDPGNPNRYIDDASTVSCWIENIGELTNPVERLEPK